METAMKFKMPNFPDINISMGPGDPQNPHIAGLGKLPGGNYQTVTISGSGEVQGNLRAERVTLSGSAQIDGDVTTGDISASGVSKIKGSLTAREACFSGSASVQGSLKSETLQFGGALDVDGDIDAFTLCGDGAIQAGAIKADEIELGVSGASEVRALSGKQIKVKAGERGAVSVSVSSKTSSSVFAHHTTISGATISSVSETSTAYAGECKLTADEIVGDDIDLDVTDARRVEGKKVRIGPGCVIDKVQYRESLDVDSKATVKERIKV
jgi:cytoskeletal protein CcmA (bactofilin family)